MNESEMNTTPAAAATPAGGSPADALLAGVRRTVLPNGLTVLTSQQKGSGVVAINTWVKAGYFNEPDEVAGMAHLFEHMFFKGSRKFPGAAQISQEVSSAGGVTNAGTIYDSTNYYFVLPKESFARGVEIQADAIANPLFDANELEKESEVVIEESNRKFDNPPAMAIERMFATAFTEHRIKRWRIGSNEVLRNINRDNLVAFFETLYRPENVIVTVAGDISHEEAVKTVAEHFGAIPKGTLKKERGPKEPAQTAFRFGRSEADLKQGYTTIGFHTVRENHEDEVALDLLASILGTGRSSRLYRAAVGPDAASSISTSHNTFDDVGIFYILSSFDESRRGEVERRIVSEIERIKQHGPTEYELALARNLVEVGFLSQMEDALGAAQTLAQSEARGSYRDIATRLNRLASMTPDQVRDAARRYLNVTNMTLYHYQPKGAPSIDASVAEEQVRLAAAQPVQAPESLPVPAIQSSVRSASADAPLQTFTLSNGAKLVVEQRTGAPLVTTGIYFLGGRTSETPSNAGVTRLMQSVMRRGTTSRTGEQIDREIEFLGAQIGTTTWDDGFGFSFDTITKFYDPALALFSDVLLNPTFPQDQVAREKALQIAAIKRTLDSATERPLLLFKAAMYGDHPYGLPDIGTEQSVTSLDGAALRNWWQSNIAGARALIVVVGNVDAGDVRKAIEARLAALPRGTAAQPVSVAGLSLPSSPKENLEQRDKKQTAMVLGFPTVSATHPDWDLFRLLSSVTSGLSGTFFEELRSKQSLAYTVFARPQTFAQHGAFISYLATEATKEEAARKALLAEIRKLQSTQFTDQDVARAKSYMAGATRISLETNGARANDYARSYALGMSLDSTDRMLQRLPSITPQDLRALAAKYLQGDNYVLAAVQGKK